MPFTEQDHIYMNQAIHLAAMGRGRTHPDPMAGCVIVKDDTIVGNGYRSKPGGPHAEVLALQAAGDAARGATAYVTAEPNVGALHEAGVTRVVAALAEPELEQLRAAGITVETGLLEAEAQSLNRAYYKLKRTGRPLVILKWAMTLDGKIACASGDSRWVTGDEARAHLHMIRDQVDAILVGETTARRDDPELTARPAGPGPLPGWAGGFDPGPDPAWGPKDPLRIVVDSMAKTSLDARLFAPDLLDRPNPNKTLIATTKLSSPVRLNAMRAKGAEILELPEREQVVALEPLLDELGRRGIASLLVEGGGRVHWSFLSQGLADYIMVYAAPKIVGGATAAGPVAGQGVQQMQNALEASITQMKVIGSDLLVEGFLKRD